LIMHQIYLEKATIKEMKTRMGIHPVEPDRRDRRARWGRRGHQGPKDRRARWGRPGHQGPKDHAHEDVYVALRDAFKAARRQLQDSIRKKRGKVKQHEAPPHARVTKLYLAEDYGFLEGHDEVEIYFHRNAVLHGAFDDLSIGTLVRYVLAEGEGRAALHRLAREEFDVVLLDVLMPGMSGPDLAQELTGRLQGLRVLFMSGHSDEAVLRQKLLPGDVHFIQKPFTGEEVCTLIREILDAG